MEKKVYETPEVTKVEFDTSDRITATECIVIGLGAYAESSCWNT